MLLWWLWLDKDLLCMYMVAPRGRELAWLGEVDACTDEKSK
jgi:hypothetical protein